MDNPTPEILASAGEAEDVTIQLHPNGDAVLVVRAGSTKRFLVSSQILQLASKYFNSLFSGPWTESQATQRGECPHIPLKDDDPDAMEIILSILHFRSSETYESLEPEMLAKVARHSDKYQCNLPLRPWISQWVRNVREPSNVEEHGLLLTAAYLFGFPEHFQEISSTAIRNVPAGFDTAWANHDIISFLPQEIKGECRNYAGTTCANPLSDELEAQIWTTVRDIRSQVESVEGFLRGTSRGYMMQRQLCLPCGRLHPATAKRCHPCSNAMLYPEICTSQARIAEYFEILGRSLLWPTDIAFRTYTISSLAATIKGMVDDRRHRCDGDLHCPLKKQVKRLGKRVEQIVEEIRGIRLGASSVTGDDGEGSDEMELPEEP